MDRLANRLGDDANVLRVSIHSDIGKVLGSRYDARVTPIYVILDGEGQVMARHHTVPSYDDVLGGG